ncbi:MAG: aminopeptidase P family protein [Paracoccaceae bacterium]|nr:aminopeptidase P family protein [Paracoccaceae bacterium]
MYQDFNVLKIAPYKKRLQELRVELKKHNLDGFLIPRTDLHQNEYIEPCEARLEWITGFTGSAGLCLVTLKSAFIFVDGRYTIQIEKETDSNLFTVIPNSELSFKNWFHSHCKNQTIGYDPWLHTVFEINNLKSEEHITGYIKSCDNLVDLIWIQKPNQATQLVETHRKKFSGVSSKSKRSLVSKSMVDNEADAVILTKPDSICWLLNIRGKDIIHTPIIQSLAIVQKDSSTKLFLRNKNLRKNIISFLGNDVEVIDQRSFSKYVSNLTQQNIQIDPTSCPMAVFESLKVQSKNIIQCTDPCLLPKAIKNPTEIKGARLAHLIDAAAFIEFLHWLDSVNDQGQLDEIVVTKKLEEFRNNTNQLEEIAFDTICGSGSNGAIVHYRVTEQSNKKLEKNNLLLIDSGGQYRMGTTDLTRTIAIGRPRQNMINIFTHVLKGMIKISSLNWPEGLSGQHIDSLAREPLWSLGLDYEHGTGHGVGSYLSVHEGPQGISRSNDTPLRAGMLVSNEPGYYEKDQFGIRIENILLIKKLPKLKGTKNQMLAFDTLTLVPIDKTLINTKKLTEKEKDWLNSYHDSVYKKLAPLLPTKTVIWLKKNCSPI